MAKRIELDVILKRFKEVHGDKYDYSKITEYKNTNTPIPIICPKHGVFYQKASKHFIGQGCPKCAKNNKMDNELFKEKARQIHGNKYLYDKIVYKGSDVKILIICPKHGEFWQTPHMHLSGQGCPECCDNITKTTEEYIKKCREVHGNKYDYSKVKYINAYSKVKIICPIHGEFEQRARTHSNGHGCPQCSGKRKYDKEYFLKKAKEIHGDRYDYSLITEIKNNKDKIPIICPKHGIFYQAIENHILQRQGCPRCQRSLLEENIANFLNEKGYKFEEQKRFKWLGLQRLDFYLPKYNIAIECQGIQHLTPCGSFGSTKITKDNFYKKVCRLDDQKNKLCEENGIKIIYYAETDLEYRYPLCRNKNDLLKELILLNDNTSKE